MQNSFFLGLNVTISCFHIFSVIPTFFFVFKNVIVTCIYRYICVRTKKIWTVI